MTLIASQHRLMLTVAVMLDTLTKLKHASRDRQQVISVCEQLVYLI